MADAVSAEPPLKVQQDSATRSRSGKTIEQLSVELDRLNQETSALQEEIEELCQRWPTPGRRANGHLRLTAREEQVLRAMAWGFHTKEVASQIGIGPKSVDTYRARGFKKLGLRSRHELVRYAVEQGWLTSPPNPHTSDRRGAAGHV